MGLYVPFAPSLLGAIFFLKFNFLISICYVLLSSLNIYLMCPIKSLKKQNKKKLGLYQNRVTGSLASILRPGNLATTVKWSTDP